MGFVSLAEITATIEKDATVALSNLLRKVDFGVRNRRVDAGTRWTLVVVVATVAISLGLSLLRRENVLAFRHSVAMGAME